MKGQSNFIFFLVYLKIILGLFKFLKILKCAYTLEITAICHNFHWATFERLLLYSRGTGVKHLFVFGFCVITQPNRGWPCQKYIQETSKEQPRGWPDTMQWCQ